MNRELSFIKNPNAVSSGQHQHQVTWVWSRCTTPRSLEDSPCDLRTTGEWNTTSVPFQSCGTWDSIREAENPAWPGSQVPSSWCQHLVTWAQSQLTSPKSPRGQLLRQTPFWAPDIGAPSLPEKTCPPCPWGLCWITWGTHLGSRIPLRLVCRGESVDYRSWQLLWQDKATQLLEKVLFLAYIFGQEKVQTPDICAPSL